MAEYYAYELTEAQILAGGMALSNGNAINFTCKECPVGADCRRDNQTRSEVVPLAGYYPDVGRINDMFIRCLLPAACIGGQEVCTPPYTGPLCTGCEAGFRINTDWSCSKCVLQA